MQIPYPLISLVQKSKIVHLEFTWHKQFRGLLGKIVPKSDQVHVNKSPFTSVLNGWCLTLRLTTPVREFCAFQRYHVSFLKSQEYRLNLLNATWQIPTPSEPALAALCLLHIVTLHPNRPLTTKTMPIFLPFYARTVSFYAMPI